MAKRDAADAFMSAYGGAVELRETEVAAVTDRPLPDDVTKQVLAGLSAGARGLYPQVA